MGQFEVWKISVALVSIILRSKMIKQSIFIWPIHLCISYLNTSFIEKLELGLYEDFSNVFFNISMRISEHCNPKKFSLKFFNKIY